jgi:hypothetical protein
MGNGMMSGGLDERFRPGTMVLLWLSNPREKFWGVLLQLSSAGVAVRGLDLSCFDDTVRMLRHDEPVSAAEVFFPMHRVERIETDAPNCGLPSLSERFESGSGTELKTFLQF